MDFNGCSGAVFDDRLASDEVETFVLMSTPEASFPNSLSRFSAPVVEAFPKLAVSRDVPGVLGVFMEDPKDAKAPEPSPKAEDAPFGVGEEIFVVLRGDMPLNGLGLPLPAVSLPKRFTDEYGREASVLLTSLLLVEFDVDKESLLELLGSLSTENMMGELATYMERRCQRLLLLSMMNFHSKFIVQSWRTSDMQWVTQWRME